VRVPQWIWILVGVILVLVIVGMIAPYL